MLKKGIIGLIILITLVLGYNYIYQDHRNIEEEKAEFILTSNDIIAEFIEKQEQSESKYINKTIQFEGVITELNEGDLTLDKNIFCKFDKKEATKNFKLNDLVTIKGRCIGFDDLLEQIKLDQCSEVIE